MAKKKTPEIKLLPKERRLETVGTGLSGYLNCSYKQLVGLLGKPNAGTDGYKIDAAWSIEVNGKILTIYNYKDGKNYNGRNGLPVSKITDWHVGSHGTSEGDGAEIKSLQKMLDPKKKCKVGKYEIYFREV